MPDLENPLVSAPFGGLCLREGYVRKCRARHNERVSAATTPGMIFFILGLLSGTAMSGV